MAQTSEELSSGILCAQCWEDPEIDREAFRVEPDDTILCVTSGGCNALTFLLDNPRALYALDMNPHQNYLLDLKMGAFSALGHGEMLELLGVRESARRRELYARVRGALGDASRKYWDERQVKLDRGIIHAGRIESSMRLFRRSLEHFKGKRLIRDLFEAGESAERLRVYREQWDTALWRLFTRIYFSRMMMSIFFPGELFRYVEGSFSLGKHLASLVERALTRTPPRENYFASYLLLGRYFDEDNLPPYLMRDNFSVIRSRLARVHMVTGSCAEFLTGRKGATIQKFTFSSIFDWMSAEAFEGILREAWRVASHGAVITYRNLLVFRERPPSMKAMIRPDRALAESLHARDRSLVYRNYVVERVNKRDVLRID